MYELAPLTGENIPWDILINYCDKISEEIKVRLIVLINDIKSSLELNKIPEQIDYKLIELEACLDRTWEDLNTGHWKDVPVNYRHCYTICSLLKCILLEVNSKDKNTLEEVMKEIAKQIDKGLLLGAPIDQQPELLTNIASKINNYCSNKISSVTSEKSLEFEIEDKNLSYELLEGCEWLKRYKTPSMETFYREIFKSKVPAVLEDCIGHWKALTLWKDQNYLIKIGGMRTVPIEIGSSYTEDDWSQQLLTLAEFIKGHVAKKNDTVGYLAQHQLFEQIPELKNDFTIPDYCNFTDDDKEDSAIDINAWFGPKGTVSPLHYDPRDNLLCQVFGYKQVILYHPDDSKYLYTYDTRLLCNTAQADPINPDYNKFPEFKKALGFMCHLKPGEILYIPPKWWHHVVSLSPSFSISFWWN
ncbi:bifunctional peptidase and arginyl-hydroxylase JMJD5 [Microplitis mediator]|uniref:bifunctional peptidase and arginyl-hydroxylase JMJD5 n=1 Tax=Microplitis mediator TaxID=375433 RepID=UPI0025525A59|nr:bifunctional peptidase and arginyl-hydroxylase JMJD5 [Microplitis mediator]XP_057336030.1 bifunctional peptidase and arginyl-hydroxylase JMJD5 [Microplitis mediator]